MQYLGSWLQALVWLAFAGCGAPTATGAGDGALPGSAMPDGATDAATPPDSAPRASVDTVIPIFPDDLISDPVDAGTWTPTTCGDQAQQLSVEGSSPLGLLRITRVGVRYWSGFTYGTGLVLEGTLGDQLVVLTAENATSPTDQGLRPELPPGQYRPGNSWDNLYLALSTRESRVYLHDAELTIDQHDSAAPLRRGAPIDLRGRLRVFESGWSLDVPFAITRVCETTFEGSPP